MELYFVEDLSESSPVLRDEQFRHAVKVMRKRIGDNVTLTDGRGTKALGQLQEIGKREATILIDEVISVEPAAYNIKIALALTKNIRRIEWALEKMTEMGVGGVYPIICARSERDRANMERLNKILISALKQSQQYFLPMLHKPVSIDEFCKEAIPGVKGDKFIAHLADESRPLQYNYSKGNDVVLIIGPEGDFTEEEITLATNAGCSPVSLGHTRLRTETAAVAAVAYIHALND